MKSIKFILLLLICSPVYVFGQALDVGKIHQNADKSIALITGNMPLVISVPHGGSRTHPEIPTRNCKDAVTGADLKTIELALEIQNAFFKQYGLKPYLIICYVARKNVDQNRPIDEGTCGNEKMRIPWIEFHHFIDTALSLATKQFGSTLYIDLHGHGHEKQRLEIGYGLSENQLSLLKTENDNSLIAKKSSINNLLQLNKKLNFKELLIGDNAFGTMMANIGIPAVPSKQDPFVLAEDKYFDGGFNTRLYTSAKYPNVFGWQVEANYKGVRDDASREKFAQLFAAAIMNYLKTNTTLKF